MNEEVLKWVGIGVSVVGAMASILSSYISDKKTEDQIQKKVNGAILKLMEDQIQKKVNEAILKLMEEQNASSN